MNVPFDFYCLPYLGGQGGHLSVDFVSNTLICSAQLVKQTATVWPVELFLIVNRVMNAELYLLVWRIQFSVCAVHAAPLLHGPKFLPALKSRVTRRP